MGRPARLRPAIPINARILVPFEADVPVTPLQCARAFSVSDDTARRWADTHGLGRRILGGSVMLSLPAVLMALDKDAEALHSYWAGKRSGQPVEQYFSRAREILTSQSRELDAATAATA